MKNLRLSYLILFFILFSVSYASGCGNVPSSLIKSCYPLNITNTQSSATSVGFQQELTNLPFNALAGNFIVYNSISGSAINSWVQSNSIAWINLGSNTINAGSSANGIYYIGLGSSSTNFFNTGITGEAPQLSEYISYEAPSVWYDKTWLGKNNGIGGNPSNPFNGTVTMNGQEPSVIYTNNSQLLGVPSSEKVFKMWWRTGVGYPYVHIDYAESLNGYNWTMYPGNNILSCGPGLTQYGNSISNCLQPFVMEWNNTYYLYMNANNNSSVSNPPSCLENVYTSSNGVAWTIAGINVTNVCSKPNWITSGVMGNRYVWYDNNTKEWMKLQEASGPYGWQTGLFTANSPLGDWTMYGVNAILGSANPGVSEGPGAFGGPELHIINNTYYVWGQCNAGVPPANGQSATNICMAYTSNVLGAWHNSKYNPVFFRSKWWENATGNSSQVADPSIVSLPNDTTFFFYEGIPVQQNSQLAVAKSNLTLSQIVNTGQENQTSTIQISGYGKYDNGGKVFNYYQNYSGSTLWSGLHNVNQTLNLTQNNGLQVSVKNIYGASIMLPWNLTEPFTFQNLMTYQNSQGSSTSNFQEGLIVDSPTDIAQNLSGNPLSNLYSSRMDIGNGGFYQINYGSTTLAALSPAPTGTYLYTGFNNFTQVGSTVVAQDRGYMLSNTIATQLSGGYVGYQMLFTTNTGSAFKVQYSLVRTPPPNNVQPTLSFSGNQNVNTTVSVSPSSLRINPGQNVLLTANANYGNGTYTYQWYDNSACTSTISGATSSTYLASPTNTTIYCVKVTSGTSTATALSTVNINNVATNSGGGSSSSTFSISDNINIQSNTSILNITLINPSTKAVISTNLYTQSQLPLTLTLSNEEAVFNFACSLTIGSTTYNYSNDIYGLGYGNTCGKNYTVYGGSYEIIYSPLTTSTTSTNTSTTSSTSSTSTITSITTTPTINNNSIKNISLNSSNYLVISSKNTTTINSDQNAISLKLYNPNINSLSAVLILKNVTSSKTIPSINNKVLITAFSVNVSTTSNVSIYTNIHYSCNINSKTVAPYILQNNTWNPITPFSVNATSCSVLFSIPKDPIIALFYTNNNTKISNSSTKIPSNVTTTQSNSSNNDLIYYVIVIILFIIVALYLIIRKKK